MDSETENPQYQTLCGNIYLLDDKVFAIACTLCESQFQEPEEFFGHILTDHIYDANNCLEVVEEPSFEDVEEEQQEPENCEEMEALYLEEEYVVPESNEFDPNADLVEIVYHNSVPRLNNSEKYDQYIKNFEDLEPILDYIRKCHWIWNGQTDQHKIKNSSLRFLRHKYYLAHRCTISAKDLEYKIRLLKSMRRLENEFGEDDEYIKRLEFFNTIYYDFDKNILECPEEECSFLTASEDELCQHIFESHFVPDEKIYKCDFCDMRTKTYKTYLKHIKLCGTSKNPELKRSSKKPDCINMQCLTCGEELGDNVDVFNQHMRQHNKIVKKSEQNPVQIHKFETRKILVPSSKSIKRPVQKQISQDDLECDICGLTLRFTDVDKFNEHMRNHNKIQLFKCRVCKKVSGNNICEECLLQESLIAQNVGG